MLHNKDIKETCLGIFVFWTTLAPFCNMQRGSRCVKNQLKVFMKNISILWVLK